MRRMIIRLSPRFRISLLIFVALFLWSLVFFPTYMAPFVWDDLHTLRHYSFDELAHSFHGSWDPDGLETPALRPIALFLYNLQGTLFRDNTILYHIFTTFLMFLFLLMFSFLLLELGLSVFHIAIVIILFCSSHAFASLILWLAINYLLLAYIFMVLSARFFLAYLRTNSMSSFILTLLCAIFALFTREEAYTLPIFLLLISWISAGNQMKYKRTLTLSVAVFLLIGLHYLLRTIFIPGAPQPRLALGGVLRSIMSAWIPGGYSAIGDADHLFQLCWIGLLGVVAGIFIRIGDERRLEQCIGFTFLGVVFCMPSLAVPRSFGLALPSLAFFSSLSIAIIEINRYVTENVAVDKLKSSIAVGMLLAILLLGPLTGIRRSQYVADALRINSTNMVHYTSLYLFGGLKSATIPSARRESMLAYFRAIGIHSLDDVDRVLSQDGPSGIIFKPKYDYLSF